MNLGEFKDFMFCNDSVYEFQAILETGDDDLEHPRINLKLRRGANEKSVTGTAARDIKLVFKITQRIELQELGALAKAFETSVKAPRSPDERK